MLRLLSLRSFEEKGNSSSSMAVLLRSSSSLLLAVGASYSIAYQFHFSGLVIPFSLAISLNFLLAKS